MNPLRVPREMMIRAAIVAPAMAPPGKPDDFSPYLEGGARRKS